MIARWVALAIAFVTLLIVGTFALAVLRHPQMIVTEPSLQIEELESTPKRFTGYAGPWAFTADVGRDGPRTITVVLSIADSQGRPAELRTQPTASLSMIDMDMGDAPMLLVPEAGGRWRGSGRISMDGRWMLKIELDGNTFPISFGAG